MSVNEEQQRDIEFGLPKFFGTEQPETCRNCGARTEFHELSEQKQLHQCINCGSRYLLEFES